MNSSDGNGHPAHDKLPDSLAATIARIQAVEPPREAVDRVRLNAQQMLKRSPQVHSRHWRRILPASAVLAASVALAALGISLFAATDAAFAQVQQAIRDLEYVTITSFWEDDGERVPVEKVQATRENIRTQRPDGIVTITSLADAKEMVINPGTRTVEIYPLYDTMYARQRIAGIFRLIGHAPSSAVVRSGSDSKGERRYVIDWEGRKIALWIRDGAILPTRMTILDMPEEDSALVGLTALIDASPIADDAFVFDPPADYSVTRIAVAPTTESRRLNVIPGVGFEGLEFGSSIAQVFDFLGEPDAVKRHAVIDESRLTADDVNVIRAANEIGSGADVAMNLRGAGLPVRWSDELIYDSQGFRLIVDERGGLTMITVYRQDLVGGGRNRSFDGMIAGSLKIGDSPEDIIAAFGEPDNRSGLNESTWNGVLLYWNPFVKFGFRDLELATVQVTDIETRLASPGR